MCKMKQVHLQKKFVEFKFKKMLTNDFYGVILNSDSMNKSSTK